MKKTTLLAGVATGALAIAAPAYAADLRMPVKAAPIAAPAPYFSWTGCYIGAHLGWGWGKKDFGNPFTLTSDGAPTGLPSVAASVDTSGAIFGGQLGCNYQFQNNFVIGIEGSVSGADINGFNAAPASDAAVLHAKTDFLASVTGRLGWNGWDPRTLFYVKGGVAWAHDRYEFLGGSEQHATDQSRTGWTIGVGVEWVLPFAPSWTAFAEYDHYDFGSKRALFTDTASSSTHLFFDVKQTIETVRVGVNYRFGGIPLLGKGVTARY